ncbi:proline-rich protein HaeIII subfamily 1-like [Tiliqua scincoides]|uniref:proline-rich protein HaeIII subfamily 1-like n=1 Tax=Tiliqua scincoides TaxID=71010 RepID=UPI003463191D
MAAVAMGAAEADAPSPGEERGVSLLGKCSSQGGSGATSGRTEHVPAAGRDGDSECRGGGRANVWGPSAERMSGWAGRQKRGGTPGGGRARAEQPLRRARLQAGRAGSSSDPPPSPARGTKQVPRPRLSRAAPRPGTGTGPGAPQQPLPCLPGWGAGAAGLFPGGPPGGQEDQPAAPRASPEAPPPARPPYPHSILRARLPSRQHVRSSQPPRHPAEERRGEEGAAPRGSRCLRPPHGRSEASARGDQPAATKGRLPPRRAPPPGRPAPLQSTRIPARQAPLLLQ